MENSRPKCSSSSSSSIAYELFGPKQTSQSCSSTSGSSSSIFGSVFAPLPTGRGVDSSHQLGRQGTGGGSSGSWGRQYGSETHLPRNGSSNNKEMNNPYYHQQETTIEPCHYSSSIYYGGQDVYAAPSSSSTEPTNKMERDGPADDGPDAGHVNGASRGNWWQGSVYY